MSNAAWEEEVVSRLVFTNDIPDESHGNLRACVLSLHKCETPAAHDGRKRGVWLSSKWDSAKPAQAVSVRPRWLPGCVTEKKSKWGRFPRRTLPSFSVWRVEDEIP
jgi:hypothetical protein